MKDVGLRIRVQRELREEFIETCKVEDKSAAQVLREFMRDYIDSRGSHPTPESEEEAGEK